MASIYQKKPSADRQARTWTVRITGPNGLRYDISTGLASKPAARSVAEKLERLRESRIAGDPPPANITHWLNAQSDKFRARCAKAGLLNEARQASGRLLLAHVDDWEASMKANGRKPSHYQNYRRLVRACVNECNFQRWNDINLLRVERWLASTMEQESPQSTNHKVAALKAFCGWMVTQKLAESSPLAGLQRRKFDAEERRWGAMTAEQLVTLVQHTRQSPTRRNLSGQDRADLYYFGACTAIRSGAIKQLTKKHVHLDAEPPYLVLPGAFNKNGKMQRVPLNDEVVAILNRRCAFLHDDDPILRTPASHAATMLREDLQAAELPTEDSEGLRFTFHSLRHSAATILARQGVPMTVTQRLLGHKTAAMTQRVYTHTDHEDLAKAAAMMPSTN